MEVNRSDRDAKVSKNYGSVVHEPKCVWSKLTEGDLEVSGDVKQKRGDGKAQVVPKLLQEEGNIIRRRVMWSL